jgi:hypothetical protein
MVLSGVEFMGLIPGTSAATWDTDEGQIVVDFDGQGRAADKWCAWDFNAESSAFGRLSLHAKRLWRKWFP